MTDLNWSTQLSEKQRADLTKVQPPGRTMADIPIEDLPAALASLRAVADCIYGMCFYGEPERDLWMALQIIQHVQGDLGDAKTAIQMALLVEAEEGSE